MKIKLFRILFVAVFIVIGMPKAFAADIPVLSWETGQEHNIILRGGANLSKWTITLEKNRAVVLGFSRSAPSAKGYVVYSTQVPVGFQPGIYSVVTTAKDGTVKTVAGVNIVKATRFDVLKFPGKLVAILITLIMLLVAASVMRSKRYEKIQYLRPIKVIEFKGVVKGAYKTRETLIDDIDPSILKFLLIRGGELLHNISPRLWGISPYLALIVGAIVGHGTSAKSGVQLTSVAIYAAVAAMGILDPFSGISASFGFILAQSFAAPLGTMRIWMSILAFSFGWILPGIFAALFQDAMTKDSYPRILRRNFPDLAASALGAMTFYACELLANSFNDNSSALSNPSKLFVIFIGIVIFMRAKLERYLVKGLHLNGKNYQIRTLDLPRVISPRAVGLILVYIFSATYIWTGAIGFSLGVTLIFAFTLSLLLVRFNSLHLPFLLKFQRHIFLEASLLISLTLAAFIYISRLPYIVVQKGEILILLTGLLALTHAIFSSVHDATHRTGEVKV